MKPSSYDRGRKPSAAAAGICGLLPFLLVVTACSRGEASPDPDAAPAERVVVVRTLTTAAGEVSDVAGLPADLLPLRRAALAAEVAGTVEAVHVDEGAEVAKGQVLIEIDTRTLEQQVAEAEAVERQRQAYFDRAEKLLERRSITEQQYLDAVTARAVAVAQLESARLLLEKSGLKAPWAGTVAIRRVEVGDYVIPGQSAVELVDVRRLKVRAPAPSSDVPFLRPGLPAEVRVDAYPGEVFDGEVVRLAAELDSAARTLDVEVEIPNHDRRLRPGMYARLELLRRTLSDVVVVPLDAVIQLEDARVLYVVEDERAVQRRVTLGLVLEDEVVVEEGLGAGERVIVEGQQQVSPGQRVIEAGEA
ncbi:MAG: efflux RND transporter periplasmic adaptor subunit [bacterium]|nr:efflux RND transporter periplasmic adaptor subunit [bacterium]